MKRLIFPTMAFVLCAVCCVSPAASANEKNLWVSHYFTGMNNYAEGDYQDALKLCEAAAQEAHKRYRSADTHEELGNALTALGRFDEAESHYREAIALKRKSLGKHNPQIASTLNNLADLLYIQNKTDCVEGLYREALDLKSRDQKSIQVCRSLNGLALLRNDASDYVQAEELLKRAVDLHERAERRDDPFTATALTNLGILYTNLQRYEEAEPLFERAKYIHDRMLNEDHPDVSLRMHATAALYNKTGRTRDAVIMATAADAIRAKQTAKGDLY